MANNNKRDYTTYGITDRELSRRTKQHKKMAKNTYWAGQAWMSDYNKVVSQVGHSSRAVQSFDFLKKTAEAYQKSSDIWDKGYSKLRTEQIRRQEIKKLGG